MYALSSVNQNIFNVEISGGCKLSAGVNGYVPCIQFANLRLMRDRR